jgi:hypothetical protein
MNDLGLAIELCDKGIFERYMHQLQDTYSHYNAGYRWPWTLGHAFAGQWPDRNGHAWQQAEEETQYWVDEWIKYCGCLH